MKRKLISLAALAVALMAHAAVAQELPVVFDETTVPTNPENGFGSFTHSEWSGPGEFVDGPTSLILDIQDNAPADGNNFGGAGVDYGNPVGVDFHDFDPATTQWELRIKILANNAATAIRTTYIEDDGGSADEHIYEFDLTGVPVDGQFHTLTKLASNILFTQGAFGFFPGDTINNPGLRQVQIQSVFGVANRLNVEIDYVRLVNVIPEPASLSLLALAVPAMLLTRRRRGEV
jgi:hypothetical protein